MNLHDVLAALKHGGEANGVNRLFEEAADPQKWEEIKNSPYHKKQLDAVRNTAETYESRPIPPLTFSLYGLFDKNGSRSEYERVYFEKRGRLNAFAILSLAGEDDKSIRRLEDILWSICDEYTWCLPAHLGGRSLSADGLWEHRHTIDLFSAETGFALAEITRLLADRLSPLVVNRIRHEIRERILEPYCSIGPMRWWETCDMNWAAVCAGSVGAAAMYLIQEDEKLAPVLHRLLSTMESFLDGFADDGACMEGLGYWYYGFGFFVSFAALLKQRTAGRIDLMKDEKVHRIALFQQICRLGGDRAISFSDSDMKFTYNPGLTCHLNSLYPDVEIPEEEYMAVFHDDPCHRWAHDIRDLVWGRRVEKTAGAAEQSYYLPDAQWMISRSKGSSGAVCFAAKGGNNDEPHNHNDIGGFIFHAGDESLIADIGAGEYTKAYFGPERYSIFCNGSQGHSVPIVGGHFQSAGGEYAAKILEARLSPEMDVFRIDMAGAYKNDNLEALVRSFEFHKGETPRLILRDEYTFKKEAEIIVERFIALRKPELHGNGRVRLTGEKGGVEILFDPPELEYGAEKVLFLNHQGEKTDVYTVDFTIKNPRRKVAVSFEFGINF